MRHSDVNEAINKALDVASPSPARTSLAGDPGAVYPSGEGSATAPVKFAGERAGSTSFEAHQLQARTATTSPAIHELESLAEFSDEGETGWNAQQRNDLARKMQQIAAGINHYSCDEILGAVIRAEQGELHS